MTEATQQGGNEHGDQPEPQPATLPLLAYLDGLMADLQGRVPPALEQWDPAAIHQSRVATRRMKAALDLMKPVLPKRARRAFNRIGRKLRRRLGPLRDADVMLEHLQELGSEGRFPAAIAWLSQRLRCERDKLRRKSAKGRSSASVIDRLGAWQVVRMDIAAASEAVDSLLAESLHLQLDTFAEQADRLGTPSADDDHQDPHQLRIAGKALRYTIEMAGQQGHELPGMLTKTFKKMQDALGLWHDHVVLAEHTMQAVLDERLSHHEPELTAELFELLRECVHRASQQLEGFKALWSEEGDAVARAIRASFPLTRSKSPSSAAAAPANESQTDRDPSGSAPPAAPDTPPPAAP